jgi:hypothetical protein
MLAQHRIVHFRFINLDKRSWYFYYHMRRIPLLSLMHPDLLLYDTITSKQHPYCAQSHQSRR